MLKINNIEITKDTMVDLLQSLKQIKIDIREEQYGSAEHKVNILIENLDKNIKEDSVKEKCIGIRKGDRVKVVYNAPDLYGDGYEDRDKFIGLVGTVIEIDTNWEYPYTIEFDNDVCNEGNLWKAEELEFVNETWDKMLENARRVYEGEIRNRWIR